MNWFLLIFSGFILVSCDKSDVSEEQAVATGDTNDKKTSSTEQKNGSPPVIQNVSSPPAITNTDDADGTEVEYTCEGSIADVIANCDQEVPEWLKSADTELALIHITDGGQVIWIQGVWKAGDWQGDLWGKGTWKDGVWHNGIWEQGVWEDGYWRNGTWKDGTWSKGTWVTGTWNNGTWNDGYWRGGVWENGVWENGTWHRGTWNDGTWKNGKWWYHGIWNGGTWEMGLIYTWNSENSNYYWRQSYRAPSNN